MISLAIVERRTSAIGATIVFRSSFATWVIVTSWGQRTLKRKRSSGQALAPDRDIQTRL
jgi:hypothetical protein